MTDEERNNPVRIVVRKKKGHGGHHGGAWKVAYADFVTAMMALFIVLWILGQSKEVKDAIAAYFKDPGVFSTSSAGTVVPGSHKTLPPNPTIVPPDRGAEMERLRSEAGNIQKMIASIPDFNKFKDKIQVMVTPEGLRIDLVEVSEGLFFDIGKANLKPETVRLLKLIASHLAVLKNDVVVEGYTDARPYVSSGYSNWDLSTDRANSARKALEESGIGKNQIREVRGFADRNLKVPERPLDYANRRVSILVKPSGPARENPGSQVRPAPPGGAAFKVDLGK